jgi:hypothetical protein
MVDMIVSPEAGHNEPRPDITACGGVTNHQVLAT